MFRIHSRLLIVFACAALLAGCLFAQDKPTSSTYNLRVSLQPATGNIHVKGAVEVPALNADAKEMQFALHQTFVIKHLWVNGEAVRFAESPSAPTVINPVTKNIRFTLPENARGKKMTIAFEYGGRLKKLGEFGQFPDRPFALDDQVNARLVELANYSSWYPQFAEVHFPFSVNMKLSLPKGWVAVCSGRRLSQQVVGQRVISRWSSPMDADIVVLASPKYKAKTKRFSDSKIEIYYTKLPQSFIDTEALQLSQAMELFTTYLGEQSIPINTVKHVYSPKRFGQGRAGFARPGIIVTSEGRMMDAMKNDATSSLFQDVAHEVAHFWWNFGAGQGDWINEAFAEYFSAIAVQKIASQSQFESVLANYRNTVGELPADAPSLAKVQFDGPAFVVRYYKGSLMLDQFRRTLGDDAFFAAAREFYQTYKGKSAGTAEFRTFWKAKLRDKGSLVDQWVDSEGATSKIVASAIFEGHGGESKQPIAEPH
jgi:hypothetical protein